MQKVTAKEIALLIMTAGEKTEHGDTARKMLKEANELEAENARLRAALQDAINRPKGVIPDSAAEFYKATVCPDCNSDVIWYHDSDGVSLAVCKNKCKGWKVFQEVDRHKSA